MAEQKRWPDLVTDDIKRAAECVRLGVGDMRISPQSVLWLANELERKRELLLREIEHRGVERIERRLERDREQERER